MQSGGGGRGAMSFGRSRAKLQGEDQIKVNFSDVAGCDEAKEEVGELVEFLRDPGRFQKLGGKIPRGVLMVGPPGTGKTCWPRRLRARPSAVLRDLRFRLRRDVRRRRRQPRARHVRAGQEARAVHHLSSTRSTRSVAIAVPVSAVVMMSASRRSTSCWSRWTVSRVPKASS
jgi:ATP-dependent Zn proteases